MRRVFAVLAFVLLVSHYAVAQDRSKPEATVRSFVSALEQGDMKQASACVSGARLGNDKMSQLERMIKSDPIKVDLSDVTSQVNGSQAVVKAHFVLHPLHSANSQAGNTEVKLTSDTGTWLIVPDPSVMQNPRGFDFVNGVAYMLTNPEIMEQSREAARRTTCLSNMKQLCLAVIMLANDNNEAFKLKPQSWHKRLMPYLRVTGIFHCPTDSKPGDSYAFNAKLAGIRLAKVRAPAETILLYEGSGGKLTFRHDGRAIVGFVDGHAKAINRTDAAKLRWNP
jgi:prepilin-type processing-associated H-X9-DG protein